MDQDRIAATFALALIGLNSPAHAANASKEIGKAFLDICLLNLPDLDRIEARAKSLKWQPAAGDLAKVIGEKTAGVPWKGWVASTPPAPPYVIGIYQTEFRGEQMATCSITTTAADVSVDAVVTFVVRILELEEPVADDATPGQRLRLWHAAIDGVPVFITLGNDQNAGEAGLTWAGMVKARPAAPSLVWRFLTKVLKFL